jgi:hypothetical protein
MQVQTLNRAVTRFLQASSIDNHPIPRRQGVLPETEKQKKVLLVSHASMGLWKLSRMQLIAQFEIRVILVLSDAMAIEHADDEKSRNVEYS